MKDETYSAILDSTALAFSHISDVYYVDAQGRLRRIPGEEFAVGMFEGGALGDVGEAKAGVRKA